MQDIKELARKTNESLKGLVKSNAVVSKPISVGERHVIPLCELGLALGGGGGVGESDGDSASCGRGKGEGGGAGGAAKVSPVAVLIVDEQGVRIQRLGR